MNGRAKLKNRFLRRIMAFGLALAVLLMTTTAGNWSLYLLAQNDLSVPAEMCDFCVQLVVEFDDEENRLGEDDFSLIVASIYLPRPLRMREEGIIIVRYDITRGWWVQNPHVSYFSILNLPLGMYEESITRVSDFQIEVRIVGAPIALQNILELPSTIPRTEVAGVGNIPHQIPVSNARLSLPMLPGYGIPVLAAPVVKSVSYDSITVYPVQAKLGSNIHNHPVEYAIVSVQADNTWEEDAELVWQLETTFVDLHPDSGYKVLARTAKTCCFEAGEWQASERIQTLAPWVVTVITEGLADIRVQEPIQGVVQFHISNGAFTQLPDPADYLAADDFVLEGLPDGLSQGPASMVDNHLIEVSVYGSVSMANADITSLWVAPISPERIKGANTPVTPQGDIYLGPIRKQAGADVNAPQIILIGDNYVVVQIEDNVSSNKQDQEIAIIAADSATDVDVTTLEWQRITYEEILRGDNQVKFSNLSFDSAYILFLRTVENDTFYGGQLRKDTFYTRAPWRIAIITEGLQDVRVGYPVAGSISYVITRGRFVEDIALDDFVVGNLPDGLYAKPAVRVDDTTISIPIHGVTMVTTDSVTRLEVPFVVAARHVDGANRDVRIRICDPDDGVPCDCDYAIGLPDPPVSIGIVNRSFGALISGSLEIEEVTEDSITVVPALNDAADTQLDDFIQAVEYAIRPQAESVETESAEVESLETESNEAKSLETESSELESKDTDPSETDPSETESLVWQSSPIFTGLQPDRVYYIYARTAENEVYKAGSLSQPIRGMTLPAWEIVVESSGFDDLRVGQPVDGRIYYILSGASYVEYYDSEALLTDFLIEGLPSGLVIGDVRRVDDYTMVMSVEGSPYTLQEEETILLILAVPAHYVVGAATDIVPQGEVIIPAIRRNPGEEVGPLALHRSTAHTLTLTAVEAPISGQTVEYALNIEDVAPITGWQEDLTFDGLEEYALYYAFVRVLQNDSHYAWTSSDGVPLRTADETAPTAEIRYNKSPYVPFLNTLTFGRFFAGETEVTIIGRDEGAKNNSGIAEVAYYKILEELTGEKIEYFIEADDFIITEGYMTSFTVEEDKLFILAVRVTDNAGNFSIYVDGVVLFTNVAGRIHGGIFYRDSAVDHVVPFNRHENTINEITHNGAIVPSAFYTVRTNSVVFAHDYLQTLPLGEAEFVVSWNPLGVEFVDDSDDTNLNEGPNDTEIAIEIVASIEDDGPPENGGGGAVTPEPPGDQPTTPDDPTENEPPDQPTPGPFAPNLPQGRSVALLPATTILEGDEQELSEIEETVPEEMETREPPVEQPKELPEQDEIQEEPPVRDPADLPIVDEGDYGIGIDSWVMISISTLISAGVLAGMMQMGKLGDLKATLRGILKGKRKI